uniref:BolA family transcriptional regulator n=1 Tax=Caenorhabditis tropicalis TaxID=1561998 RepID=A0A1I7TLY6_9PELO
MTSPVDRVNDLLNNAIKPQKLNVIDDSGGCDGYKFRILIISESFEGKRTLQCHRMVQAALAPIMGETHALTIFAYSPEKWSQMTPDDRRNAGCLDLAQDN